MHPRTRRLGLAVVLTVGLTLASLGLLLSMPSARANHETIAWSDPFFVAGSTGFTDSYPAVLADGRGHVYVFYETTNSGAGATNINVTKFAAVGPFGSPVRTFDRQVNDVANVVSTWPMSAAIDPAGNLYLAWTRTTTSLGLEIQVSKSLDGGVTWLPAVTANAPNAASFVIVPVTNCPI